MTEIDSHVWKLKKLIFFSTFFGIKKYEYVSTFFRIKKYEYVSVNEHFYQSTLCQIFYLLEPRNMYTKVKGYNIWTV